MPGNPDLVFGPRRKVIFVHGCFWHLHPAKDCLDAHLPKSNKNYWTPKLTGNAERDRQNAATLRDRGWRVLILWDCETKFLVKLTAKIARFLDKA